MILTSCDQRYRLILTENAWLAAIRGVIEDRFCGGTFAWNNVADAHELVCRNLRDADSLPESGQFHPADNWIAVVPAHSLQLSQIKPVGSQSVLILSLDSQQRGHWQAWILHNGTSQRIDELRIIGSRLPVILRNDFREQPPPEEAVRWSRQRGAVGDRVQRRIEDSTVTLVGCGGIGSLAATAWAMIGTRRIRMLDADALKLENLDRTFGVRSRDIGSNKVASVSRYLRQIRPDMTIVGCPLSAGAVEAFDFLRQRSDLLLTCVDDEAARLVIAEMANRTLTAHMDVASGVQRGERQETEITADIRLMLPGQGCLACVGGIENIPLRREMIASRTPGSLPPRLPDPWHLQRAGSLISINAMAVGAALQIWLDLLGDRIGTSIWQRIDWTPEDGLSGNMATVTGTADCEICGEHASGS